MQFKLGPHNSLIEKSQPWDFSKDGDAEELEKAMIDFMLDNKGIGLAANQIGITKRVFVMGSRDIPGFDNPFAVFNPKILEFGDEQELFKEGCLSYPELWLNVKRSKQITAEYQDSQGNVHTVQMDGLIARVFQHEYDHLDGVCFVDKVSHMKLQLAMKKLRKSK